MPRPTNQTPPLPPNSSFHRQGSIENTQASTAFSPPIQRLGSAANNRVSPLLRAASANAAASPLLQPMHPPGSPHQAPSSPSCQGSPCVSHKILIGADEARSQGCQSESCSIDFENISDETREGLLDELSCPICLNTLIEPLKLHCGHAFCRMCLHLSIRMSPDGRRCPMCRAGMPPPARGLFRLHFLFSFLPLSIPLCLDPFLPSCFP